MKSPTMIYKPGLSKVVAADEAKKLLGKGWFDEPQPEPVDPKVELELKAREYGVELDRRKTLKKLQAQVAALEAKE